MSVSLPTMPSITMAEHALAASLVVGWPLHDAFVMWPPLLRAKTADEKTRAKWRAYALAIGMPTATILLALYGSKNEVLPSMEEMLVTQPILPSPVSGYGKISLGLCALVTNDFVTPVFAMLVTGKLPAALAPKTTEKGDTVQKDVDCMADNKFSVWHPESVSEMLGWTSVSLIAGIGEELLFRGFLPVYISKLIGVQDNQGGIQASHTWMTHSISNLIFGLGHLYARENEKAGLFNNWKGAAVSFVLGSIFSWAALETNCNKFQMICHFIIDVSGGGLVYLVRKQKAEIKKK